MANNSSNNQSGVETQPLGSIEGSELYEECTDYRLGGLWDQIGRRRGVFGITGKPGSGKSLLWCELGLGS